MRKRDLSLRAPSHSPNQRIIPPAAEYPGFNHNEISGAVYVRLGRRPGRKTVSKVLEEEPLTLRFVHRFPLYHEIPEGRQRRR